MTDIVERLRAGTGGGKHWMDLHEEAAGEIERLRADAERYRWLRLHWRRLITDTEWHGVNEPSTVKTIEVGSELLGSVDAVSLDSAIDRARSSP